MDSVARRRRKIPLPVLARRMREAMLHGDIDGATALSYVVWPDDLMLGSWRLGVSGRSALERRAA